MKRIGMIANRDFAYANQTYAKGDRFEVVPIDAAILKRRQDARLTTPLDGPAPDPAPAPQPPQAETKHMESAPAAKPKRPRKPRTRRTNRRDIPHAPVTK